MRWSREWVTRWSREWVTRWVRMGDEIGENGWRDWQEWVTRWSRKGDEMVENGWQDEWEHVKRWVRMHNKKVHNVWQVSREHAMRWLRIGEEIVKHDVWWDGRECTKRWPIMCNEKLFHFSAVQYQKSIHTISDILNGISANQRSALLLDIWLYLATYSRPSHHTLLTISSCILNYIYTICMYTSQILSIMQKFPCIYCIWYWYDECNLQSENSREFSREMRNDFSRFSWEFSRILILIGNPAVHQLYIYFYMSICIQVLKKSHSFNTPHMAIILAILILL